MVCWGEAHRTTLPPNKKNHTDKHDMVFYSILYRLGIYSTTNRLLTPPIFTTYIPAANLACILCFIVLVGMVC
jgi:hypothetical protein